MVVTHVNHASILIEDNDNFILTDPWCLSPAFGGWVQNPPPKTEQIQKILSIPPEKLKVIVSHGHDDHLDEFFIARHLTRAQLFVPQFTPNGLQKRIKSLTGVYPGELTEDATVAGTFRLSALINNEFTDYDSIIVIEGAGGCVVHANDNWHIYPDPLISKLRSKMSRLPPSKIYFLVQFGIADCFPLNYPRLSSDEVTQLIQGRFQAYANATTSNIRRLGLERGYYYANQSIYKYPEKYSNLSLYELAQAYVCAHELPFRQLTPGMTVGDSLRNEEQRPFAQAPKYDIFEHCLSYLEEFLQKRIGADYHLKLLLPKDQYIAGPNAVSLQSDRSTWQRIFIGELTLEAIIIGGMGLIHKPNERNISDLHHKLSKIAYQIQDGIRQNGIRFFLWNIA